MSNWDAWRAYRGRPRPSAAARAPIPPPPDVPLRMLQMGSSPRAIQVLANTVTRRTVWLPEKLLKDIRLSDSTEALPNGAQSWITFLCPYWLVQRENLACFHHAPAAPAPTT